MSKKKSTRKDILTPYEKRALEGVGVDGILSLAAIQRLLECSFKKAIEIAVSLSERGLVKSNIKELKIERL